MNRMISPTSKPATDLVLDSKYSEWAEQFARLKGLTGLDRPILLRGERGTGKRSLALWLLAERKPAAATVEEIWAGDFARVERVIFSDTATHNSAVVLHEIFLLPLDLQLRVFEAFEKRAKALPQLIVTSSQNLQSLVRDGRFKEELFFHLASFEFVLPALRERRDDLAPLAQHFLEAAERNEGSQNHKSFAPDAAQGLALHRWPGNLDELRSTVEAAYFRSGERPTIELSDLALPLGESVTTSKVLSFRKQSAQTLDIKSEREKLREELIMKALQEAKGNKSQAARLLGISREGLRKALLKTRKAA